MASFTESATLRVIDQATGPLKKIEAELKRFAATAKRLSSKNLDLKVKTTGVSQAAAELNKLLVLANKLRNVNINVKAPASSSGPVSRASSQKLTPTQAAVAAGPILAARPRPAASAQPLAPSTPSVANQPQKKPANFFADFSVGRAIRYLAVTRMTINAATFLASDFKQGRAVEDSAQFRLDSLPMTPAQRTAANAASDQILADSRGTKAGAIYGGSDIKSAFSEILPTTAGAGGKLNVEAGKLITLRALQLAALEMARDPKLSKEIALAGAFEYAKSGEFAGRLQYEKDDPVTGGKRGDISPVAVNSMFDILEAAGPVIGREMSGSFTKLAVKYFGSAKFSMNDKGFLRLLLSNEELGTKASVGISGAIKTFGNMFLDKKQTKERGRLGLNDANGKTVGMDLLQQDPGSWVQQYLIPALKKDGVDVTDPTKVAPAVNKVLGNRNSADLVTGLVVRSENIENAISLISQVLAQKDPNSPTFDPSRTTDAQLSKSSNVADKAFDSQVEGFFGAISTKLEPYTLAIERFVSDKLAAATIGINATPQTDAEKNVTPAVIGFATAVAAWLGKKTVDVLGSDAGKAIAQSANTVALVALTAAVNGNTAAQTLGGGLMGKGGILAGIMGALKFGATKIVAPIAVEEAVRNGLNYLDPEGNLGGLTTGVDNLVKKLTGIDPSNVPFPETNKELFAQVAANMASMSKWFGGNKPIPVTPVSSMFDPDKLANVQNYNRDKQGVDFGAAAADGISRSALTFDTSSITTAINTAEFPTLKAEPFPMLKVDWSGMPTGMYANGGGKGPARGNTGLGNAAPMLGRTNGF